MLQLRPYQQQAVDAVFDYWSKEPGNPLVELSTGTGKSLCLAELTRRLVDGWPDMRIVIATHVAELIAQNFEELVGYWPFAPAGILSAGLNSRDTHSQILFAGIQTAHSKVSRIGHVDVLMVDECHTIPAKSATMYGRFIADLRAINPDMKIVGLTATPYRLDSGRLDEGDDRLFDRVVYTYGIADGIRDGYLAPLSSKPTATAFDLNGVHRLGGDYKQSELQAAVDKDAVNRAAVDEIIAKGQDRRSWLAFCSGVEHAIHIRDAMRARGISCETVTGETPKEERRRILEDFKAYKIRCVTNNSVLTTGFNHKGVDLLAFLRPTLSVALYVQMAGRATRPLYAPGADLSTAEGRLAGIAAGPKPNALVLDFAGLVRKHGPVDMVEPKRPGKGDGEAPVKQCPKCEELVHASVRECPCCGHEFEFDERPKITAHADVAPILSTEEPDWQPVRGQTYHDHVGKASGLPSVRVMFMVGLRSVDQYLCPGHKGRAKEQSDRYWHAHGGMVPFPKSVDEFLDRVEAGELRRTSAIKTRREGKYDRPFDWRADNDNAAPQEVVKRITPVRLAGRPAGLLAGHRDWADDDIPF